MLKRLDFFSTIGIFVFLIVILWFAKEYQEEKKLTSERKLTSMHIREAAKLHAEQNRVGTSITPIAPSGLTSLESTPPSDQDELAQIQQWEKTPADQRHALQSTANNR